MAALLKISPNTDIPIGLSYRKQLHAAFHFSLAFDVELSSASGNFLHAVASLFSRVKTFSADLPQLADSKELHLHFRQVVDRIIRDIDDVIVDTKSSEAADIRQRMERVAQTAQTLDCHLCSLNAGALRACDGSPEDIAIVSGYGQCWFFFRDVTDLAVAITNHHYTEIAADHCKGTAVILSFATSSAEALRAQTTFCDTPSVKKSMVEVRLPVSSFSINAWLDLFYMLMHEVFVHSVQNTLLSGQRSGHGEDCPFSEGYMDCCAYTLLQDVLGTAHPTPPEVKDAVDRLSRYVDLTKIQNRTEVNFLKRTEDRPAVLQSSDQERDSVVRREIIQGARSRGRKVFELAKKRWSQRDAIRLGMIANLAPLDRPGRTQLIEVIEATLASDTDRIGGLPGPRRADRAGQLRHVARNGSPGDIASLVGIKPIWA